MRRIGHLSVIGLVTLATVSVSPGPVVAQSVCYRPDGSMYIGRERPADCSPTRPQSRDEDVQRRIQEEAAGRAERDAARRAKDKADQAVIERYEKALAQEQADKIARKKQAQEALKAGAEQALKRCDALKYQRAAMNAEQAAICDMYWSDKATKTLKEGR